ncbi:hypothetical protein J6590_035456 [Homalodisca vitripennis]|nr:hypothetical protein J6590_035456 [Homalodisca vitripennis]
MNIRYAGGLRWVIINPKIPNPLYPDKPQSNTLSSASRPPTVAVSGGAAVQQITRGGAVTAVAPPSHPATPAPAVPPPPSVSAPQDAPLAKYRMDLFQFQFIRRLFGLSLVLVMKRNTAPTKTLWYAPSCGFGFGSP